MDIIRFVEKLVVTRGGEERIIYFDDYDIEAGEQVSVDQDFVVWVNRMGSGWVVAAKKENTP